MTEPWQEAVEEHRQALEALAEHGRTELATDAKALLDTLEDTDAGAHG